MTALEIKILDALKNHAEEMNKYDAERQATADEWMKKAAIQTEQCWKKEYERKAQWSLHFQNHGYDFLDAWLNVIALTMYGRVYSEWHSAQAGKHGKGHAAYTTTELSQKEEENVGKVFQGLLQRGYLKKSKSGNKATFKG